MRDIIPFDFEEQAVRVVLRDNEPWFVAADVCRVLELQNVTQAVQRLDEDEVTLCQIEGSHRPTNLISESGLYALVIRSDKPAARRFRKWITAEVLPAIRRTGRYVVPDLPAQTDGGDIAGLPLREAELWLSLVREARLTRGRRAAVAIWDRSPLPGAGPIRANADHSDGPAVLAAILHATAATLHLARTGTEGADPALAREGLRALPDGLFVANAPLLCLSGTRWADGGHRTALATLPGAMPAPNPLTLQGLTTRGIILPWALVEAAMQKDQIHA